MRQIRAAGAVGDVCGRHFARDGRSVAPAFDSRIVAISSAELTPVPLRLGVATGPAKGAPIPGALRARYVNVLVMDSETASGFLRS